MGGISATEQLRCCLQLHLSEPGVCIMAFSFYIVNVYGNLSAHYWVGANYWTVVTITLLSQPSGQIVIFANYFRIV